MPRRYETYTSMQGEVEDWLLGDTLFNPHIGGRIMLFGRAQRGTGSEMWTRSTWMERSRSLRILGTWSVMLVLVISFVILYEFRLCLY